MIVGSVRRASRTRSTLLCLLAGWALTARSQVPSNWHERRIVISADTISLDSLSLVPGSLQLLAGDSLVSAAQYELLPFEAKLVWRGPPSNDTLTARYRVMPLLLAGPVRHKDPGLLQAAPGVRPDPFKYVPSGRAEDPFGGTGLNKSGSISRGVLFGNTQDLAVNSTLNLELNGRIADRINVLASISDNNIPIQAGGNTQELQDFDQVFIKLFEDDWELIAGDIVLQRPKSHFLNYFKKIKGLSYSTALDEDRKAAAGATAAISKGKFARNTIQGVEGVQGPYRLRGDQGEQFVIVLSGTERVFIDGQLMTRGQENDYVIDYNTAELTFTANRLITKDRRIVVEFQYSDKNYVRSLVRASGEVPMGARTLLRVDAYSEQDHRNQPLQQQLSDEERSALAQAGDDPLAAIVPGADSVAFSNDQVLYARRDSLGYDPVYVYSTSEDSAHYRVVFSTVPSGSGDYVQQEFTPNGRVFRWIAPDTVAGAIVRHGDHAPVRVLVAPRTQQMVEIGVEHRFAARARLTSEFAFSNEELNTFSSSGNGDDQGVAFRAGLTNAFPLTRPDTTWRLILGADVEALTKEFRIVERYRPAEFERNWNATTIPLDNDQLLIGASAGVDGGRTGRARVVISTFNVRERYAGVRPGIELDLHPGRWDLTGEGSLLSTQEPFTSAFLRHRSRLAHRFRRITLGYRDEHERNTFRVDSIDGLRPGSYEFHDWEGFVQSPDTSKIKWRLGAGQRNEEGTREGTLAPVTRATHYNASFELAGDPRNRIATTFSYRSLAILDTSLTSQKPEDTYLGRVDYDLRVWKDAIALDLFYELGSGLEPRQEYIYVQVPAGQGLYIWIDYNDDGIKQLNEFELANFGYEADYIRVFTPTNDYVRTYSNQFSASLDLRPGMAWQGADGLKAFVGKFSDLASFRTDRKTGTTDLADAANPFLIDPLDTALTAFSSSGRNTLYFDRTSRTWSIDHTYQNDRAKNLLLNGYESRTRESNALHLRWNTTPQWTAEVEGEVALQTSASDLIEGRSYRIAERSTRPRLTWQPGTTFRGILSFKYSEKTNAIEFGGESAVVQDMGLELRYNVPAKGVIQATADLVRIAYDGEVNSVIGNALLQGLKPGTNITWGAAIQRNLSGHLQIDLTYNGRSSEGVPVVHVGGAQVRAFF